MTRLSLVPIALLLVSCANEPAASCPGERVGSFQFEGCRIGSCSPPVDALAPGLDPDPTLTDCAAAITFPSELNAFDGTLSADATGPGGALCPSSGLVLFGTRSGTRFAVEEASDGAVLGGCGSTCAARSRVVITGDVVPDLSSPTGFTGALVEQLTRVDGDCGTCALPCAARYALTGTPEAP